MLIALTLFLVGLWSSSGDAGTVNRKPQSAQEQGFRLKPLPMDLGVQTPFGVTDTQTHAGGSVRSFKVSSAASFGFDGGVRLLKISLPYHIDADWSGYRGLGGFWGLRSDINVRFDDVWRLGSFQLSPKTGIQYIRRTVVSGSRFRLEAEVYDSVSLLAGIQALNADWLLSVQLLASPLTWSTVSVGKRSISIYHLAAGLDAFGAYRLFSRFYLSSELRIATAGGKSGFFSAEVRLGALFRLLDPS